jgi:hypothetical protein
MQASASSTALRVSGSPSPTSASRAARLTWSRQPRGPRDYPADPGRTARAGPELLFPLFYLVEIRHRQLLQIAISHPLTG